MSKNARKFQSYATHEGVKVNLRISQNVELQLQALVKEGYYLNRNDAIRDALNFFLSVKPWIKRITAKTPIAEILK